MFQDLLTRKTIGGGHESDGLYYFDPHLRKVAASCASPNKEYIFRWHCHLGHPSISSLRTVVPFLSSYVNCCCESCELSKHHRTLFPASLNKECDFPRAIVHSDVWGPAPVVSISGHRYFVSFIDDFSRMTWIYLMKSRDEVFTI